MSDDTVKLVDRLIQVKAAIKKYQDEEKELIAEIKEDYELGEVLFGSEGIGYELTRQTKLEYGLAAIKVLKELDLLEEFVSISTSKLETMAKAKKIPWALVDKMQDSAILKDTLVVRQFVPEESKVIS